MKKKTLLIITILFLSIGFAAVSTTLFLNGTIKVGTNQEDFDVYFSDAILDGEQNLAVISSDKKTINFETKSLSKVGEKSILEYEITNASTQYDANVSVTCTPNETELYKVINTIDKEIIEARTTGNGAVTVELKKNVLESQKINFTCTINSNALERESTGIGDLTSDDAYVLEGTYVDSTGKAIPNANLVVYSDTPKYVTTDASGNLLVGNLERGKHEIYYVNDTLENIKNMTKEQIINKALTSSMFYTSSKEIKFKNNNSIGSPKITLIQDYCSSTVGKIYNFDYTGTEQEFSVLCEGEYKLETWGAQGGASNSGVGGYGGYSTGTINLDSNSSLNIVVGGSGSSCVVGQSYCTKSGGYNGGGNAFVASTNGQNGGGGGGATHIALSTGLLSTFVSRQNELLIVAAGGGGAGASATGGAGGGINGVNGYDSTQYGVGYIGTGATQQAGGITYWKAATASGRFSSFGQGGQKSTAIEMCGQSGGGGGYYGGGASSRGHAGAGGGSGYIGNSLLKNKDMYCYKCSQSTIESTKTTSTNLVSANPEVNKAKTGNGYARITYLGNV